MIESLKSNYTIQAAVLSHYNWKSYPVLFRYENGDTSPYSSQRIFHCVQSNQTQAVKRLLVSVVVPASLYNQIDYQMIPAYGAATRLMFAAFDNSSLFPSNLDITQVIGCKLLGAKRNLNLTDPVVVSIILDEIKSKHHEVILHKCSFWKVLQTMCCPI